MRKSEIETFLIGSGWGDAVVTPLAGDASRRRYFRLIHPKNAKRAVLMDAPPESGEDVRPFTKIAEYLRSIGLSAPDILSSNPSLGLSLIEDLGDDLFARVVTRHPELQSTLYEAATDLLIHAHEKPPPGGLATYDPKRMVEQSSLVLDWYVECADRPVSAAARTEFAALMNRLIVEHAHTSDVLIQRDYHSENLLWLPERSGLGRVGLLDFQDATLGHRMYDLVSLLQDARRDVPVDIEASMRRRYIDAFELDADPVDNAYATLGAQRNLRILGVFARLGLRDGKPGYLDLMPRVWGLLERDLTHPALYELRDLITSLVPPPDTHTLDRLRKRCETVPMHS